MAPDTTTDFSRVTYFQANEYTHKIIGLAGSWRPLVLSNYRKRYWCPGRKNQTIFLKSPPSQQKWNRSYQGPKEICVIKRQFLTLRNTSQSSRNKTTNCMYRHKFGRNTLDWVVLIQLTVLTNITVLREIEKIADSLVTKSPLPCRQDLIQSPTCS